MKTWAGEKFFIPQFKREKKKKEEEEEKNRTRLRYISSEI